MTRRIFYDGLNLALERGTGIATYTRVLTKVVHDLGHEVGIVYNTHRKPAKNPLLREIGFFNESSMGTWLGDRLGVVEAARSFIRPMRPVEVNLSGLVVRSHFEGVLPTYDSVFLAHNVFANAARRFYNTGYFADLSFERPPDIFHCTYQLPLRVKSACNVYTIHDLVPLRLPFATLDNKRKIYRLLKKVAADADHIVTVSESSKHDIVTLLGVSPDRVTNTYEAISLPEEYTARSDDAVAEHLTGSFGLGFRDYLLFFGALEPKKNVGRLIEAYLASGVDIPLVLVTSGGWRNDAEAKTLQQLRENQSEFTRSGTPLKRKIVRFEYVSRSTLVTLIRGARALIFPSLYEGFGLPVLEAMTLGTPVVTSRESSLPEVAGDAAILVNPYEIDEIARAIATISADADLRAELTRRGKIQAEQFSLRRYQERIRALYGAIG